MLKTIYLLPHLLEGVLLGIGWIILSLFIAIKCGVIAPLMPYIVLSGSMEPEIPTGSVVVSQPFASYKPGDIITYFRNGNAKETVTHRISLISQNGIITTKGDANKQNDLWEVSPTHIKGKVVVMIPYLGYVVDVMKRPQGFIALVIVPSTIIIYEELKNIWKELLCMVNGWIIIFHIQQKRFMNQISKPAFQSFQNIPIAHLLTFILATLVFSNITLSISYAYFSDNELSSDNHIGMPSSFFEHTSTLYESADFSCENGATDRTISKGTVVLTPVGNDRYLDVSIKNGLPTTTFDIWVNQYPGLCPLSAPTFPQSVTTDDQGVGIIRNIISPNPGSTHMWVSVVHGSTIYRSTAVEL